MKTPERVQLKSFSITVFINSNIVHSVFCHKETRMTSIDVVMMPLLLTLNIFNKKFSKSFSVFISNFEHVFIYLLGRFYPTIFANKLHH